MSNILVTPGDIRTVAGQVMTGAAEIEEQRRQLMTRIQELGQSWQGVAATAMQDLYQRWDAQAVSLHGTLTEVARAMQSAADHYEIAEQNVAKSFRD